MINGKGIVILASLAISGYANAKNFEEPVSKRIASDSLHLKEKCEKSSCPVNKEISYNFSLHRSVINNHTFLEPIGSASESQENVNERINRISSKFLEKIGIYGVNTEFNKGLRFTFENKSITLGESIKFKYEISKNRVSLECKAKPLGILDGDYFVGCRGVFKF